MNKPKDYYDDIDLQDARRTGFITGAVVATVFATAATLLFIQSHYDLLPKPQCSGHSFDIGAV